MDLVLIGGENTSANGELFVISVSTNKLEKYSRSGKLKQSLACILLGIHFTFSIEDGHVCKHSQGWVCALLKGMLKILGWRKKYVFCYSKMTHRSKMGK